MTATTLTSEHLIRDEVWSTQLKEELLDELMGMGYVNWISDFPDGDTFTIPSISQHTVDDYTEDTDIVLRSLDTGEFQFTINNHVSSGTYVTDKNKQDNFYMSQLLATFVPGQKRAIMQRLERDIMNLQSNQTASDLNNINGAPHRFVASGTNEVMTVNDFAKALYSLKKANVPQSNLIAIVDPSVEYTLNTLTNISNVSNNPRWEGIVESGLASGMKFVKNIFGFDVYTSNYLADANETIDSVTTAAGKANLFFSADADILPFIGAWREMPTVETARNARKKRDETFTTARYGLDLYRRENLVCVLSDTDQV